MDILLYILDYVVIHIDDLHRVSSVCKSFYEACEVLRLRKFTILAHIIKFDRYVDMIDYIQHVSFCGMRDEFIVFPPNVVSVSLKECVNVSLYRLNPKNIQSLCIRDTLFDSLVLNKYSSLQELSIEQPLGMDNKITWCELHKLRKLRLIIKTFDTIVLNSKALVDVYIYIDVWNIKDKIVPNGRKLLITDGFRAIRDGVNIR